MQWSSSLLAYGSSSCDKSAGCLVTIASYALECEYRSFVEVTAVQQADAQWAGSL